MAAADEAIRGRFAGLNPYDPSAVGGSILRVEDENFGLQTRERRQLHVWGVRAKRYALSNLSEDGRPIVGAWADEDNGDGGALSEGDDGPAFTLRKPSEHGLGHLLNPTDPDDPDRDWIGEAWQFILATDALS